ncbi:MAG TPA: MFS transporter [Nocardioides sp.]|nr:MFS transporter [Nocardioides sp.]
MTTTQIPTEETEPEVRPAVTLGALFVGAFVICTSELLLVGVLDLIAADLGVSAAAVGTFVTGYALGLAIGGPALTALTIRADRRTVLAAAMILTAAGDLVTAFSSSYELTLAARTATGAMQGLFLAAAFAAGTAVVPAARAGRAIAVVLAGTSISTALGVPVGTLAGHLLGWRGSYAAVAALIIVATLVVLALFPPVPAPEEAAGNQARHAFAPPVLAVLGLCALVFGATMAALTYLVPFLTDVTGISGGLVSVFLLAYGAATAVGSFGGGWFADRNAERTLIVGALGITGSLAGLYLFGSSPLAALLLLAALGVFAMGSGPSLQYRVVALAGPGGALAQSLPASAVNVGIAAGSFAGGIAIERSTASGAVLAGLALAALAIPVAWATRALRPPASRA